MITPAKIKILAVGSQNMLRRLQARVDENVISLQSCNSAFEIPEIWQKEPFDLIIVDNLSSETEAICRNTLPSGQPPVAVLFTRYGTDWKKLRDLDVDGFFPDEAGSLELMARIKAFSRRRLEPAGACSQSSG